jgi:adenosylhomocysteine nucleosidase
MASILVVAPLKDEAGGVCQRLVERGFPSTPVQLGALTCTAMPTLDIVCAVGGNGKTQFGVQAQHLLDHCRDATLLVCVGGAGQLSPGLSVGDVVVGTHTIEHDYHERFNPRPQPRHHSDVNAVAELRQVVASSELGFRVHFGPIASGDEDIINVVRRAELYASTEALCVAWEGSGGARAARFSGVGFVEIRVITDAADEAAADSFHEHLDRVLPNIADLLIAWRMAVSSPRPT